MSAPKHDERGAIAIMFGLLSVLLLIVAAFAVDLGNAYAHKREIQKDADLSTLAGAGIAGANLPGPNPGGTCSYGNKASPGDQAVKDVALYLSKQLNKTISASDLTNCKVTEDGEVFYGRPTQDRLRLVAGLQQEPAVAGVAARQRRLRLRRGDGHQRRATSTASRRWRSARRSSSVLPFYAFTGCDYGAQTLQQPNNGQSADPVMLYLPNDASAGLTPPPGVDPCLLPCRDRDGHTTADRHHGHELHRT